MHLQTTRTLRETGILYNTHTTEDFRLLVKLRKCHMQSSLLAIATNYIVTLARFL